MASLLLIFLSGCSSPQPVFKAVTVDVPVAVPCRVPEIQRPSSALQQVQAQAALFDKVKAALIEIDNGKAYEARLEAALRACQ
jgi:hypothetical protein